jgi:hypothetical protein
MVIASVGDVDAVEGFSRGKIFPYPIHDHDEQLADLYTITAFPRRFLE